MKQVVYWENGSNEICWDAAVLNSLKFRYNLGISSGGFLNCKELTKVVIDIQMAEMPFAFLCEKKDLAGLHSVKGKINLEFVQFQDMILPLDSQFFDALEADPHALDFLQNKLPSSLKLNNNGCQLYQFQYRRFLKSVEGFIRRNVSRITPNSPEFVEWFRSNLNSAFLQAYQPDHRYAFDVKSKDLPRELKEHFGRNFKGFYWRKGTLAIDELSGSAFEEMEDGDVEIGELKSTIGSEHNSELGKSMTGGSIHIKKAEGNIGYKIHGGTIVVERAENANIAASATGGTIFVKDFDLRPTLENVGHLTGAEFCSFSSGGTFIFGKVQGDARYIVGGLGGTVLIKCKRDQIINKPEQGQRPVGAIMSYDEEKDELVFCSAPQIREEKYFESSPYINSLRTDSGLLMLTIPENFTEANFSFLENGIVWIKNAGNCQTIGRGMTGGTIVIDDPKISYEEACKSVAPISDRHGVVLYLKKWTEPVKIGKITVGKKRRAEFMEIR